MVKQNESKVTTDQTWCENLAHIWLLKKTTKKTQKKVRDYFDTDQVEQTDLNMLI